MGFTSAGLLNLIRIGRSRCICHLCCKLLAYFVVAFIMFAASRNISDWWLAYWISHNHKSSSSNNSSFDFHHMTSYHSSQPDSSLDDLHLQLKKDSLTFYLVVYGGIAAANSVGQ